MEPWLFFLLFITVPIIIYNIFVFIGRLSGNKRIDVNKHSTELPRRRFRRLTEKESRALKAKQERASMMAKKSIATKLPSEFYRGILLPKNRVKCPRCGMGYKIYALYGGENTRYGCDWCGRIFT